MFKHTLPIVAASLLVSCGSARKVDHAESAEPAGVTAGPVNAQPMFNSADDAVSALRHAAQDKNLGAMAHIVGLPEQDVLTGDPQQDQAQAERFATACDERLRLVPQSGGETRVFIGADNYALATKLVKQGDKWYFDSAGSKDELTLRAIGEDELAVIGVCRAYVQAQYEYYSVDRNGDDVLQYAQRLGSTQGKHDGLYWHVEKGEEPSPLGSLVAAARAQGFLAGPARNLDAPKPYHGYLFKILTAQGEHAPGGKYSYIINDRMVAGFALVAYPAKWNRTGIMTFIVGANGKVYQKNLGEGTADTAGKMVEFDPDATWSVVQD